MITIPALKNKKIHKIPMIIEHFEESTSKIHNGMLILAYVYHMAYSKSTVLYSVSVINYDFLISSQDTWCHTHIRGDILNSCSRLYLDGVTHI